MAIPEYSELSGGLNVSDLYSGMWKSLPPEVLDKFSLVIDLGIALLAVSIAYFVILIIVKLMSFIFGSRESRRLKKISEQLDEVIGLMNTKGKKKSEKVGKKKKDE